MMKIKEVCKCGAKFEIEDDHELTIEERQDIIEKKHLDWIKRHRNCNANNSRSSSASINGMMYGSI